jgi:hypothetical protein
MDGGMNIERGGRDERGVIGGMEGVMLGGRDGWTIYEGGRWDGTGGRRERWIFPP